MQQATQVGYPVELAHELGTGKPYHIRDGIAFAYKGNLHWVVRVTDADYLYAPHSHFGFYDLASEMAHQLSSDTIRRVAVQATWLLDTAQKHVDQLPTAITGQLPSPTTELIKAAEAAGEVLRPLLHQHDQLLELACGDAMYLAIIHRGQVTAAARMRGDIGVTIVSLPTANLPN